MKKFIYTVFLLVIFVTTVSATTTKNGVPIIPNSDPQDKKVEVSCKYSSGYTVSFLKLDRYETNGLYNQGRGIPDGIVPNMGDYLLEKGFMTSDGYYDCPKYALYYVNENNKIDVIDFSNKTDSIQKIFTLIPEESSCVGACQGEQFQDDEQEWICDYTGSLGKIQTKYDGIYFFIDHNNEMTEMTDIAKLDKNCSDLFYNPHFGTMIEYATYDILKSNDKSELKKWYDFLCIDEEMIGAYYCSGDCNYPENKRNICPYLKDKINNTNTGEMVFPTEKWTCDYQSTILNGTTIQTKYDGLDYILINRDGENQYVRGKDISSDCGDIFLNTAIPGGNNFRSMDGDIRKITDLNTIKDLYSFLCSDNHFKGGIEYYCSGDCKYPNNKNVCSYLKDKINYQTGVDETEVSLELCQNNEVKKSLRFIGWLLVVVKIIVPLLLIIFGVIDFVKVVISSENEASDKAVKRLIMRIITGVVIFVLPTIINFVFGLFPKKYHFIDCSECIFKPNSCQVDD